MSSRTKYEFFQDASLSQKLAHKIPIYSELAGADPETSLQIAIMNVLEQTGRINPKDKKIQFIKAMLNAKRMALFATSEKVNEISKMGMQLPKAEGDFGANEADDEENP